MRIFIQIASQIKKLTLDEALEVQVILAGKREDILRVKE